jgi:hypothetical protein
MLRLRELYPKLDMDKAMIREFLRSPLSPQKRAFAATTEIISADLKTRVTPCQFGASRIARNVAASHLWAWLP